MFFKREKGFLELITDNPDAYGPFWVSCYFSILAPHRQGFVRRTTRKDVFRCPCVVLFFSLIFTRREIVLRSDAKSMTASRHQSVVGILSLTYLTTDEAIFFCFPRFFNHCCFVHIFIRVEISRLRRPSPVDPQRDDMFFSVSLPPITGIL